MNTGRYFKSSLLAVIGAALGSAFLMSASISNAAVIVEIEANDTTATAQNVNGFFDLSFDTNIENSAGVNTSTIISHVQISGTGNGTLDYYSFSAAAGSTLVVETDCGVGLMETFGSCTSTGNVDTFLRLLDSAGNVLFFNDDTATASPFNPPQQVLVVSDTGSNIPPSGSPDSFMELVITTSDTFFVEVGECCGTIPSPAGTAPFAVGPAPVLSGGDYVLNISVGTQLIPEPGTLAIFGLGLAGLGFARRRRVA